MTYTSSPNASYFTKTDIAAAYSKYIEDILADREDLSLYFVTTVFRSYPADFTFDKTSALVLQQYGRVYRHVTSRLMNHWNKKRHLHPTTFDFLDVPGSRASRKRNPGDPLSPHFHSIYLVNNRVEALWEKLIEEDFLSVIRHPAMGPLISICAMPLSPKDLRRTLDYSCKLLESRAMLTELRNGNCALINQFPITSDEQRVRRLGLQNERLLLRVNELRDEGTLKQAKIPETPNVVTGIPFF